MRRINLEDSILNYFSTAPLPAAELMLKIVTGAVKRRAITKPLTPRFGSTANKKRADDLKRKLDSDQPIV